MFLIRLMMLEGMLGGPIALLMLMLLIIHIISFLSVGLIKISYSLLLLRFKIPCKSLAIVEK